MKIKFLLILYFVFLCSSIASAARKDESKVVHKGNVVITVGYGIPSIIRAYVKRRAKFEDVKITGYGPFILKVDYWLNSRFSVGVNGMYNYTKGSGLLLGYDPKTFERKKYENGIIANEASVTVRGNYHFWVRKKTESYGGLGVGYGYDNMKSYTKAPTAPYEFNHDFPSPFRFEATYGFRYFPVTHIGIYTEVGLGKVWPLVQEYSKYIIPEALFQVGISIKL